MAKNRCIFFLTLLSLFMLSGSAWAFQSVYKATFTASISFGDSAPVITHTALDRVSLITKIAVIEGTATDDFQVTAVNIFYKKLSETNVSTANLIPQMPVKAYNFSYQIPQEIITESIQYRISVFDSALNETKLPADGSWFTVQAYDIPGDSAPVITHTALERVSLITKTAIIEGTAVDDFQIASVNIYNKKLSETNFSTSTLIPPAQVKEYKFAYQIPQDMITESIQYRISVFDSGLNETKLPADGSWFTVQAYDTTPAMQIGSAGGLVTLADGNPDDGETSIEIPAGALGSNVNISISEVSPNDSSVVPLDSIRPVAVFRFEPKGLVFNKLVKINLLYQDVNNDGIVDKTQYAETGLKIMWWDGFDWRYVGGKVDNNLNLVSTRINHFSLYGIFPAPSLTDNAFRPKEKIVTPASADNYNDYATFGGLEEGDVVNIYDVTGKTIRQLKDTTIWDGKDDNGDMVESGLYIYQIKAKATGKIISGTIVIAK